MPGPAITNVGATGGVINSEKHMGADKWRPFRLVEKVTLTAAQTATLTQAIPANAIIAAVQFKYNTAVVLSTATTVSLGITGDPNAFIESSTTVTINTETTGVPLTTTFVTASTPVILTSTNGSGAAAGAFVSGTVTVQIFGWYFDDIDDA